MNPATWRFSTASALSSSPSRSWQRASSRAGVVLWHQPGDETTAQALAEAAAAHPSHVVVAPLDGLSDLVLAASWGHRKSFTAMDDALVEFIDVYRRRGAARADCPLPAE